MSLRDWPPDLQIAFREILDYLCHRLLTLISPTYRVLEALGDPRAQEMKDAIRKRVEEGEWLGGTRAQEIRDSILKHLEEVDWLSGRAPQSDSTGPHVPGNAQEQ